MRAPTQEHDPTGAPARQTHPREPGQLGVLGLTCRHPDRAHVRAEALDHGTPDRRAPVSGPAEPDTGTTTTTDVRSASRNGRNIDNTPSQNPNNPTPLGHGHIGVVPIEGSGMYRL